MTRQTAQFIQYMRPSPFSPSHAGNWPHWWGPLLNGSTEVGKLPTHWSTTENVVWSAPLRGAAASTPIVWDDRVFLTGVDQQREVLEVRCLGRRDGSLLWGYRVAHEIGRDHRSNFASNSPVTDGEVVVFGHRCARAIVHPHHPPIVLREPGAVGRRRRRERLSS